jgi:hypothetical protein
MKTILIAFCLAGLTTSAQPLFNDSVAAARRNIDLGAMTFLGAEGAVNIATGFIAAQHTTGEARRFWRMNAYWGIVNLGIAAANYIHLQSIANRKFSFAENMKAQQNSEKIYLLNFGLDITYITAGLLLNNKGNIETDPAHRDELKGYGKSIVLQGGILLLMDGIVLRLHHRNTARLNHKLEKWEVNSAGGGLGLAYHF